MAKIPFDEKELKVVGEAVNFMGGKNGENFSLPGELYFVVFAVDTPHIS